MEPRIRQRRWPHLLAMSLTTAVLSAILFYVFLHTDFIPNPGSLERGLIDDFMRLLFAIAGIVFAIVVTAIVYALVFFRRRKDDNADAHPVTGNVALEIVWTVVPLIIVVGLGIYGAQILDEMSAPNPTATTRSLFSLGAIIPGEMPASSSNATFNELAVNVTASRFAWQFDYPDYGITSYALEVPVNQRILFNFESKDVIHSFWVQQWGPKQDAVPGLSPSFRITPTEIGEFLVQCSQLCGPFHTEMTAPVHVVSQADFNAWVTQQQSAQKTTPPVSHITIDLTAHDIAFDKSTITVPAGAEVVVSFDNTDAGVPHNFAVYTDASATQSIFVGDIVTGPKRIAYTFTAPSAPGNYFFRCDAHPIQMTGIFTVQ